MIDTDARRAGPARRPGRKRSPLPPDGGKAITELKTVLRGIVGDTPLEQVAAATNYSPPMISAALGGTTVPSLNLTRTIAARSRRELVPSIHELWFAAAREQFKRDNPEPSSFVPLPKHQLAKLAWDLRLEMLRWDIGPGQLLDRMRTQVDDLNARARVAGMGPAPDVMSASTLARLLKGQTLPDTNQLERLLRALGVEDSAELRQWYRRFERIEMATEIVRALRKINPDLVVE